MRKRWPFIKSRQSKFPLMSLIGANALPLFARDDGNLTLSAILHATNGSTLSVVKQSPAATVCVCKVFRRKDESNAWLKKEGGSVYSFSPLIFSTTIYLIDFTLSG